MHAAKIYEVARKGVPPTRGGIGVTILLKNIAGITFVNKLRAIFFFQVDFNYWTKLFFAQRMTKKAREEGGITDKVYAKKDSHCDDATMTKVLFCDSSRITRHPAAISAADHGKCYDRMAHPLTSIDVQS